MARPSARTPVKRTSGPASSPQRLSDDRHLTSSLQEIAVLTAALLLLSLLGYAVSSILSPFVITGAILFLLFPFRSMPLLRRLMWLAVLLFLIWFFHSILGLLAPFLVAFLAAYLVNPLVTRLERRGLRRWVSSLVTVVLIVATVSILLLFGMPIVIGQFEGIISQVTGIVQDFSEFLRSGALFQVLTRYGIPVEKAQEVITQQVSPRLATVLRTLLDAVFGLVNSISSVALQLINVIIIPFLVFYLLKDFPQLTDWCVKAVPGDRRQRFREIASRVDALLGKYFRGAVIVAFIQGMISGVGLWIIGVPYALVLGIMSGVLNFIPYVGLITSLVVASLVALVSGGAVGSRIIAVIALYLSQKVLEATVFGPKIIGSQVGLHPVLLILCLLIFGYFLGFVGLLIAVPTTALILAFVNDWHGRRSERAA